MDKYIYEIRKFIVESLDKVCEFLNKTENHYYVKYQCEKKKEKRIYYIEQTLKWRRRFMNTKKLYCKIYDELERSNYQKETN